MNPIIRSLMERKSVRAYTEQDIPEEAVQTILAAAANAPTAGNQQLYTILRITDPEKKRRLADSCDHQPFIAQAKLVLVFCADCLKWYDAFRDAGCEPRRPGPGDLMLAVDDALVAAQNAVVAAQAHGIGSCYIGDIMENIEVQRELLGLPEWVFPAALLVFGYPTEQQRARKKPARVAMAHIVHENGYRDMDAAELEAMLTPRMPEGRYVEGMRAFCARKNNSDFAREMSRSAEVYLRDFIGGPDPASD